MRTRAFVVTVIGAVLALIGLGLGAAAPAQAASLQQITNWGANPTNLSMYLYVPANVSSRPAVLVGVHWCWGSGTDFYNGTGYARLADRYGFVVIYPSVNRNPDHCWDVASTEALRANGSSDPAGIKAMVDWTMRRYNGDPNRVFVTGHSSGGMMTNVMLADYPGLFKAGSASAGVPFSCFASHAGPPPNSGAAYWNGDCAQGRVTRSAQQWGDAVRAANPGYRGPFPRVQLWHGTADDVLSVTNFAEEIKMWTNVAGVSQAPSSTDYPAGDRTRTQYKARNGSTVVEGNRIQNGSHNIPINAADVVHFFGLDGSNPIQPPSGGGTSAPPPTSAPVGGSTTAIAGSGSGRCLDIPNQNSANGTVATLWDCNGGPNQRFTLTSSKQLQTLGKCLDVTGQSTAVGTPVQLWDCNGQTNQQWNVLSDGTIRAGNSGLCLDATGEGTANSTPIQVWDCNGQANQRWTRR